MTPTEEVMQTSENHRLEIRRGGRIDRPEEEKTLKHRFMAIGAALALTLGACTSANPGTSTLPAGSQPAASQPGVSQPAASAAGEAVNLSIESWRNDDLTIWQDQIIPAFEKTHPNIKVTFNPTAPADYNGVLNTKLEGGSAGDLITCRPFDASLALFTAGNLASLNDLAGLSNFSDVAKSAWITDDSKDVFCVPMASVIHGFIYNKDVFDKLGITSVPTTLAEFHALLDKIKAAGVTPLDMGTKDLWESATMGFQNIGPDYWKGEDGRKALIAGTAKFTDAPYVATWKELASWAPYLPKDYAGIAYPDAQAYFEAGKAAIYPAGTWDISTFEAAGLKNIGFFGPPVVNAGDQCYISDHTDIAMGMNSKTKNPEAAKAFLEWVAGPEFASLYSNALPGFYSLSNASITLQDSVAQQALDLRKTCKSTIRNSYQILSRGTPNLENELWRVTAAVINGKLTPEAAAKEIQDGLNKWYKPAS
jgi:raffinose/stachyose/melibiose transport system substrate-binding protein